jgi:two-component system CheB/CheR fusion protein
VARKKPRGEKRLSGKTAGEPKTEAESSAQRAASVPIVGVGASAGGLEAFSQMLRALGDTPGFAVVFVQHLAPQHESALAALLGQATSLPVVQVNADMDVEGNHVYVIPPNRQMAVKDGRLLLSPRPEDQTQYTPINYFFRSLAGQLESRAIGVILSGTASDGAEGLREIKAAGGITMTQDPESAKYDGMPRAAIATGMVDVVQTPRGLAAELLQIARHPFAQRPPVVEPSNEFLANDKQLERIFALLRANSGVDFTHYKQPTIQRRLQRRMALQKVSSVEHYIRFLQENPAEVGFLYRDILIHVTRFFREAESFEVLATEIFPQFLEGRDDAHPVRIWIPGCSTGEEPYSVAIALLEAIEERGVNIPVQIFATDVSDAAIEQARAGIYPPGIAEDVSPERLRRFFLRTDGGFRINKVIRDMCVFARQDLTRDPPFSKLDLILCRNVLIYLGPPLQKKLMNVFHYALRPAGFLMLGSAETIGPHVDLFSLVNKKHRVYKKKVVDAPPLQLPVEFSRPRPHRSGGAVQQPDSIAGIQQEANRLVLERYAPPGVIVDDDLQIVQFRGQTGRFLEPSPGDASLNLLKMAREGLLYGLRTTFHAARKKNAPVRKEGLRVKCNGHFLEASLEIVPLGGNGGARHYLVLFEEITTPAPQAAPGKKKTRPASRKGEPSELQRLEQELAASRDYLQSMIQDLEAANEELQSANEEILSSNEELQSTNEELDTAKEELQSTNEELNTLNEELQNRNEELSRVNSDLINLLSSIQIAIVIVSSDLRIRRFTPMAERLLNLIPGDIGRPIGQIKPNFDCPDLQIRIGEVIDHISVHQQEVRDAAGNRYSLIIRPYKDVGNRIDGAVLSLYDSEDARQIQQLPEELRKLEEAVLSLSREPMLLMDERWRVAMANPACCTRFGNTPESLKGRQILELAEGSWGSAELRQQLESYLRSSGSLPDSVDLPGGPGKTAWRIHVRRLAATNKRGGGVLLTFREDAH